MTKHLNVKVVCACGNEVTEKDTAKPYNRFKTVLLSNGVPEASLQQVIHDALIGFRGAYAPTLSKHRNSF
jgi:hypothetical protein